MAGIGEETGTVAKGKCADLIVTKDNPLEDLKALRHVEFVVAKGHLIEQPKVKVNSVVEAELDQFL